MENTPIIVADTSWAESVPAWLYKEIQAERMINSMCDLLTKNKMDHNQLVGDAECVIWLMTASNKGPLDGDGTVIYLYLTAKLMLKTKKIPDVKDLPDFLVEPYNDGLTEYQQRLLSELKQKIYNSRGGKFNHPIIEMLKSFNKTGGNNGTKTNK